MTVECHTVTFCKRGINSQHTEENNYKRGKEGRRAAWVLKNPGTHKCQRDKCLRNEVNIIMKWFISQCHFNLEKKKQPQMRGGHRGEKQISGDITGRRLGNFTARKKCHSSEWNGPRAENKGDIFPSSVINLTRLWPRSNPGRATITARKTASPLRRARLPSAARIPAAPEGSRRCWIGRIRTKASKERRYFFVRPAEKNNE